MWTKWLPWRFVLRAMARARGFVDPAAVLAQINRFSQPSEVMAPAELLRAGAVLHVRGLMNGQAIQHNLDWVWPYWVQRQFDPEDEAFVPRAFSLTHINLSHRNWTALGVPDVAKLPLVDPRGLLTPHFDGWSLDGWIVTEAGAELIPCRLQSVGQELDFEKGLAVTTRSKHSGLSLSTRAEVVLESGLPVCRWEVEGSADCKAWLVLSLRPYNPEGISFIHSVEMLPGRAGWKVNRKQPVHFDAAPDRSGFSYYRRGDVRRFLPGVEESRGIDCRVGLATAAALFELEPGRARRVTARVPLAAKPPAPAVSGNWQAPLQNSCALETRLDNFRFLYDAALRTLVLHSPGEVYPGPYTYRRFWFRDAAFILHAMLCAGLADRVERALEHFRAKQMPDGYFLSQEGEWDSNGEALWILRRWCEMTGQKAKKEWRAMILRAARWIIRKRLPDRLNRRHAGLLPAGFSAEHLGPNDFYYWDDFWGIAGLRAAEFLADSRGERSAARNFRRHAEMFSHALQHSLDAAMSCAGPGIPASPYRRMDAGAIGSMALGYPLRLCAPGYQPLLRTVELLLEKNFLHGGFFQEISHSGINPYLSLHVAQVLLRAGDPRFFTIMRAVARMASPTGQWPEAVHPKTGGGCMGDGQHVWAAAEWVLMVRHCFVREEDNPARLVLGSGLVPEWFRGEETIAFGPAPTDYGPVFVRARRRGGATEVEWEGAWRGAAPSVWVCLPGRPPVEAAPGQTRASVGEEALCVS